MAVDFGAESGRAVAGEFDGARLELRELHRFPNRPREEGGRAYWDGEVLVGGALDGIGKAAQTYGDDLASVAVDAWGVDYALVDRAGELVGPLYTYRDPRTEGMGTEARRRMPAEEVYAATGIPFLFFNTLLQLLSEVVAGSPRLKRADRLLLLPDWVSARLCGRLANERTAASTTQLYDPNAGGWARPVIDAMGIPAGLFGEITEPGTVLGNLLPALAEETGAGPLPVVATTSHDTNAAVAGVPASAPGQAFISSGTWSLMGMESASPLTTPAALAAGFSNEAGAGGQTCFLKTVCGLWLVQECRRTWADQGEAFSYAELADLASEAPAHAAVIDPDHPEFAAPGDMAARIAGYCARTGQAAPGTPGGIVRVILESLALRYRSVLEALEGLAGRRFEVVHIVGGGSRNLLLNQLAADALGRPVVAGPVEATSAGNILGQMVALGAVASFQEGRELLARSFQPETFEPSPANRARWDDAYGRFQTVTEKR